MNLLAIDTSSVACTVAVSVADVLVERHEEQAREHTKLLMPMIRDALDESGVGLPDLDAIVLGNGPGSFIGMRIAASVSQGLAHGAGLKIIPVSSLAAVAAEVMDKSGARFVAVAQDAHLHEVYLGIFRRRDSGLPEAIIDERLQSQTLIDELSPADSAETIAAGQGWQRFPQLAAANSASLAEFSDVLYPRASYLLPLADLSNAVQPKDIAPAYLRKKVAEKPRLSGS